jgi:phage-related protein
MELALGNYLELRTQSGGQTYRFQNFYINKTKSYQGAGYSFLPFGFSGVTVNRTGDNIEASLVFPNNDISRSWVVNAVSDFWIATVSVMVLDPDGVAPPELLHRYVGQVSTGGWNEVVVTLKLNTVIDAVGAEVPMRRLTQSLIGALPTSSNVRLR